MDCSEIVTGIKNKLPDFSPIDAWQSYPDEVYIKVRKDVFKDACMALHKLLPSPIMMLFALDLRKDNAKFVINSVFVSPKSGQWIIVTMDIAQENPVFETLAKVIHSASLFEREIWEMFGIEAKGNPDLRPMNLHNEVCPSENYPLRKDFQKIQPGKLGEYQFSRVEGQGIFEVPVGPVHAGIIGPGHFRFSAAGEPIINLEIRLGFTHRGVEKLFEGKPYLEMIRLSECVCGDASFAHSLAYAAAVEKIASVSIPRQAAILRAIYLELERMYNHVNDIGGIAVDVGYSFPAAYASIIKESILQLNESLTASRYLKKVNTIGGVLVDIDETNKQTLFKSLKIIKHDFNQLVKILDSSVSFMDRVDSTGALKRKTAEDLGIVGLIGRACGIPADLRKYFLGVYKEAGFKIGLQESGDVLARLRIREFEFRESLRLIEEFAAKLKKNEQIISISKLELKAGAALGYTEGWRGPILYWLKIDNYGLIERCKIVDASFHNWQGLSYAVLGNIIPDFPVCNKSFDLSYSGNDL